MRTSEASVLTETDFAAGETGSCGERATIPLRKLSRSKETRPKDDVDVVPLEQSSQPLLADSNADMNNPPGLFKATRSQRSLMIWLVCVATMCCA
jgi:hypothetical protein